MGPIFWLRSVLSNSLQDVLHILQNLMPELVASRPRPRVLTRKPGISISYTQPLSQIGAPDGYPTRTEGHKWNIWLRKQTENCNNAVTHTITSLKWTWTEHVTKEEDTWNTNITRRGSGKKEYVLMLKDEKWDASITLK